MKRFKVINERKNSIIYVTLHEPPYEDENILNKTGYKAKDCKIVEVYMEADELETEMSVIDMQHNEGEEE